MTATELKRQIKECHPDLQGGDMRGIGRLHRLISALRNRCPVCGNPKPHSRSPSKARTIKTCGQLCALRLRTARPLGALASALLLTVPSFAEQVRVEWGPSATPGVSYTLSLAQGTNAVQKVNVGAQLSTTFNLTNRTEISVRAVLGNQESDPSNTAIWEPTPVTNAPPVKPLPPGAIRVTTITTTTIIETQ